VAWYPDDHVGVVALANAGDVDPLRIALELTDPLLPGTKPHRARHPVPERLLGLWIDDDQGIVLDIVGDDPHAAVMALWGNTIRLRGDGEGAAMADALGLRLILAEPGPNGHLLVDDNGDPWGTFRRADRSGGPDASSYAGRYQCSEFASVWNLVAENGHVRVEHLADDIFAPVLPGVYTSRATTLRFTADDAGRPKRMTVDMARTTGFSFVATD
jgi:hypothetical protein